MIYQRKKLKTILVNHCNFIEIDIEFNFIFLVMIGDVNIFFNDQDQDPTFGEIEVMIAEPDFRRTGRGREALKIIMGYGKL